MCKRPLLNLRFEYRLFFERIQSKTFFTGDFFKRKCNASVSIRRAISPRLSQIKKNLTKHLKN